MIIAYIAHPISGDIEGNIQKLLGVVRGINLNREDVVPLVPYFCDLYALNDLSEAERLRGIKNDIAVLKSGFIDELWVYGNWSQSVGVKAEIKLAEEMNIPIKFKKYGES